MSIKPVTVMITLLVLVLSSAAFARQEVSPPPEAAGQGGSGAAAAAAQGREDDRAPIHKQEQWQFFAAPYLWIPGTSINATFLGHTSSASEGWYDIVPHLFSNAIGAMGRFEAWKGRWGIYLDSYFVYVGDSGSDSAGKTIDLSKRLGTPATLVLNGDLKFISRAANVDFGPRFLVGTVPLSSAKPLPALSFELLGGGRYNFYNQYIRLNLSATITGLPQTLTGGGSFVGKTDKSFLEPFLGWRAGLWINTNWVAMLRFTVGGFGLAEANTFDMDMELDLGYKVHQNIYAYAGWRARYEQFSATDFSLKAWLNGPILGAVFTF